MPQQSTLHHAREVLAGTDPDLALIQALRSLDARNPKLKPLRSWIERRAKGLSAADLNELLAFGYLGWARHTTAASTKPDFSALMKTLGKLEPDFFPVLVKEIKANESSSPSFRAALSDARERIAEIQLRLNSGAGAQPGGGVIYDTSGPGANPSSGPGALLFALGLYLLWRSVERKVKK